MSRTIILCKMYAGRYLDDNIGHEVINLFRADNGKNYVYINDDGRIAEKYNNTVSAVLLIRYVEVGVFEVIAKAEKLEQVLFRGKSIPEESAKQIEYVKDNNITYGGVYPYEVFGNSDAEKIVITFKADQLLKVARPVFLVNKSAKVDSFDTSYHLSEKTFSRQSLRMYFTETDQHEDFNTLQSLLGDDKNWEPSNSTKQVNLADSYELQQSNPFISIIKKEHDELTFSNLLAYVFEQNRKVFCDFASTTLGINDFSTEFEVYRETKAHIDLWIEDDNHVIVIENKIKSKINGEKHDIYSDRVQSQLSSYYSKAKEDAPRKKICCYIFSPDYNLINLDKYETGEYYKLIKYSQIFDFYFKNAGRMLHVKYFTEFLDAIQMHANTIYNMNYETMRTRFLLKIKRLLESRTESQHIE